MTWMVALGEGTGRKIRTAFAAVSAVCLLSVISLNMINAETPDTAKLRARELSVISPYLKNAYRNGNGSGALVIGVVDPKWHSLSNEHQLEAAQVMSTHLSEEKVREAMIYDAKRQLKIHIVSGKIRRPVPAAAP